MSARDKISKGPQVRILRVTFAASRRLNDAVCSEHRAKIASSHSIRLGVSAAAG